MVKAEILTESGNRRKTLCFPGYEPTRVQSSLRAPRGEHGDVLYPPLWAQTHLWLKSINKLSETLGDLGKAGGACDP